VGAVCEKGEATPAVQGDYKWNAFKVTTLGALSMHVIVEAFFNPGEPSKAQYRVRFNIFLPSLDIIKNFKDSKLK
jgi:hypothetical protein